MNDKRNRLNDMTRPEAAALLLDMMRHVARDRRDIAALTIGVSAIFKRVRNSATGYLLRRRFQADA